MFVFDKMSVFVVGLGHIVAVNNINNVNAYRNDIFKK